MGGDGGAETGPELAGGILLERLMEGEPFAGHLGDESVVLVRRGEEVYAIGGSCTHYGGPLGEGLVVDSTIRCPWHHACFDLRTGEAVRAPALNPVPRWEVEIRDGRVLLGARTQAEPLDALGRTAEGPESVVIVGAGAAGSAAAEMLRREGYRGPVTLVDPDEGAPYDRPNLSKDYLAGEAPEEWIPLRPVGFHAEHGIARVHARVTAIDPAGRAVRLENGAELRYGALLLATGAAPIRLPTPGAELPHVHLLRSLDDCRAIIGTAEKAGSAVVIGASFIGMEAAAALRNRKLEVTVVAPDAVPFERTLGRALGAELRRKHEEKGVRFELGHTVAEILDDRVRLDDGREIDAALVLVGVGVRPLVRLAEEAGLRVENGVLVDEYLESSAPGIYAAGDIARWPDPASGERARVEHWVVAQRQGQTAARNILGRRERFDAVPFFWTRQYDVGIAYAGHAARWDRVAIDGEVERGDCALRYLERGQTLAIATLGRDLENLREEAAMEEVRNR